MIICCLVCRYAHHIERWLDYFPLSQMHFVDGQTLRENPAQALAQLIASLHMTDFPFDQLLKYDDAKGFFCVAGPNG